MANQQVLPPTGVPFIDSRGMLDYRWLRFLTALQSIAPAGGTGFVVDSTSGSYGPMSIGQGPQSSLPGVSTDGAFYVALDTGRIYFGSGGTWNLLSEAFTGDVTKPIGSQVLTLANVFSPAGEYGGPTKTIQPTIDSKGRITGLVVNDIVFPPGQNPQGTEGALQYNSGGFFAGALIYYDAGTGGLVFANPEPTREALSPLTTKGDIFVRNSTVSTRLPVGSDGTLLSSNSATATGLEWVGPGTYDIPFQYNVVSPFPLITIPADLVVKEVIVYLEVPFDGTGADLTIGDASDNASLFPADAISVYEGAGWVSTPVLTFVVNTDINLYITPGTATQGSGIITLVIQK